jgi:vitamin B12 transporter
VRTSADASVRITPFEMLTIAAGMDASRDEYSFTQLSAWGNAALDESARQISGYAQGALAFGDVGVLNGGARWTTSSIGGDALCWQTSGSIRAKATGTALRASIGTGFKVPTLYQVYDPMSGNRDLKAEKSRYWDAAITQKIFGEMLALELGWFDITVNDSIAWFMTDSATWAGEYRNIGEAHSRGVEASLVVKPVDALQISGNYTWQRAIDEDTSKALLKRPEHKANASIAWHADSLSAGMSVQYTGERTDYGDVTLNDYVLLGARASYRFAGGYTVFASADNLLNASYQNTAGYDTPGINGTIGVKGEF